MRAPEAFRKSGAGAAMSTDTPSAARWSQLCSAAGASEADGAVSNPTRACGTVLA